MAFCSFHLYSMNEHTGIRVTTDKVLPMLRFYCFIGVTDSMHKSVCLGKFHLLEPTHFSHAIKWRRCTLMSFISYLSYSYSLIQNKFTADILPLEAITLKLACSSKKRRECRKNLEEEKKNIVKTQVEG